jgi:acyl-CoA thioesterase FadM
MLLLVRFLLTLLRARLRSRIGALEESVTRFTVLPHDCDLNLHLNAGRFVSFMDIARVELIVRLRLLGKMLKRGWRPVIGGCIVRYRRSILPFERFEIRTRVVGWDERWFYIEHVVEKNGTFCAIGHMRTVIRGPNGSIPPREVLALMRLDDTTSPELPDVVREWREVEDRR